MTPCRSQACARYCAPTCARAEGLVNKQYTRDPSSDSCIWGHSDGFQRTRTHTSSHTTQSLAEITTTGDLLEYLQVVSDQSRLLLPVSSHYFVEEAGEIKVFQGLQSFVIPLMVEVTSLRPRVDSLAFSIMGWVKLEKAKGANVLRKPLGKSPIEKRLSCWSWYVGMPANRFSFGAHDFRGGTRIEDLQVHLVCTERSLIA